MNLELTSHFHGFQEHEILGIKHRLLDNNLDLALQKIDEARKYDSCIPVWFMK